MTETDAGDPHARVRLIPERVNGEPRLLHRGRFLAATMMIEIGETPYFLTVERGRVVALTEGPVLMRPWAFAIRAGAAAWAGFWQALPAPGFHDIFAMTKSGAARIEGDYYPLMANLRYVKELLATARASEGGA